MRQTQYQCEAFPRWGLAWGSWLFCGTEQGAGEFLCWELRHSSSSTEGSQPVLLVWDTWGCCPCSAGSGCGQVHKIESASPSIIQSLEGRRNPMCLHAFYELRFCFEDGNLSELPCERPLGSPPFPANPLALGRRWRPGAVPRAGQPPAPAGGNSGHRWLPAAGGDCSSSSDALWD